LQPAAFAIPVDLLLGWAVLWGGVGVLALRRLSAPSRPSPTARGVLAEGVAAWAHTAEHLHLGWALVGWTLLLPGLCRLAQLCADAFGAGPALAAPDQ
jgi:hypothetical protein